MGKTKKVIPVEEYSRVVGYHRPVSQWNKGKKEEYSERKVGATKDIAKELEAGHE